MSADKWVVVPVEPTPGLLMSMAIRLDHALGLPGYYDDELFGKKLSPVTHDELLRQTLMQCKQLHEEVVGAGFYKAAPTGHDVPVLVDRAELEALRTGDTCGRQCEGTAYRIELGQAKREIERLRTRVADLERALGTALTREAEDMGLYDEDRADTIGQNGNDGLHYVEADAGPTPLRGRVTRRD